MTLEELKILKELCLEYDKLYSDYPESRYEGQAIYEFAIEDSILHPLTELQLREEYRKELDNYDKDK